MSLHTVLYVEDDPASMTLVARIIARHPRFRLLTAVTGNAGIAIARESRPDVILFDINLADISGFMALDILRSDSATAHIPVIALSGNAIAINVAAGLEAGFFRYLTKPINVEEFVAALDVAVDFAARHPARSKPPATPG